jgi:hypothetical protein
VTVIAITPRHDGPSRRCAAWADRLAAKFSPALHVHTTRSREDIEVLLRQHQHVLYFGHGEKDALVRPQAPFRKRSVLADAGNLRGHPDRVVVAVACWSAEGLAPRATSTIDPCAVRGYIGWFDEIGWPPEWPDPIGDAVVEGLSVLMAGGSLDDCATELRNAFVRAHDRYRNHGPGRLPNDRIIFGKMWATYWRDRLWVAGDGWATLTTFSPDNGA